MNKNYESAESKQLIKEVFVSGGIPVKTYIMRKDLERQLENNLGTCALISITGHTKTGKTVLTYGYFKQRGNIKVARISSGEIKNESEFWLSLASQLDLPIEGTSKYMHKQELTVASEAKGQLLFPFAEGGLSASVSCDHTAQVEKQLSSQSPKNQVFDYLKDNIKQNVIVIDDFHYIDDSIRKSIIRSFKQLILLGLNIITISIPHREYDAVSKEREMSMRVQTIKVKEWSIDELEAIAHRGFKYLGKDIDARYIRRMAEEAFGSPHLMQDFCLQLSFLLIEKGKFDGSMLCPDDDELDEVFKKVASKIGSPVFHQLVKGPRREGSRKQRSLIDGKKLDIYRLVAQLFVEIQPGMGKVPFQRFMELAKKEVTPDDTPQLFEITRVLKKMSNIAISDSASNPVIDVDDDERCVYVSDPYFAYYLKWGDCEV